MNEYRKEEVLLFRDFRSGIEESLALVLESLTPGNQYRLLHDLTGARFLAMHNESGQFPLAPNPEEGNRGYLPLFTSLGDLDRIRQGAEFFVGVVTFADVCQMLIANKKVGGIVLNPGGRPLTLPSDKLLEATRHYFLTMRKAQEAAQWMQPIREPSEGSRHKYH